MNSVNKASCRRCVLVEKTRQTREESSGKTAYNLALNKGTDPAFGVPNNLDIFYLCVLRKMFAEHASEVWLVHVGRQAREKWISGLWDHVSWYRPSYEDAGIVRHFLV